MIELLNFYADTAKEKNKFFSWKINSIMDLESRLLYWSHKYYIRSAWYQCKDKGQIIENSKIDLVQFNDAHEVILTKK